MKLIFPKIVIVASIAGLLAFFGYAAYIYAATSDVTGYACSLNVGCISLNPQTSSTAYAGVQPASFGVTYNDVLNEFSGSGWGPSVGEVLFGQDCSPAIHTAEGAAANGNKCAKVTSITTASVQQTGGWDGYIYLGNVQLAPDHINFVGQGWEGINTDQGIANPSQVGVGWLTFNASLQGDDGACGTAVNTVSVSAPAADLCSVGIASVPTGGGATYWSWTCTGTATAAACHTPDPAVGACGSSHNTYQATMPTGNLCAVGTASALSGSNPWSWTCTGTDNTPVTCNTLNLNMDGLCGASVWTCAFGSPYDMLEPTPNFWTWSCPALGTGAPAACDSNHIINPPTSVGPLSPIFKEN